MELCDRCKKEDYLTKDDEGMLCRNCRAEKREGEETEGDYVEE